MDDLLKETLEELSDAAQPRPQQDAPPSAASASSAPPKQPPSPSSPPPAAATPPPRVNESAARTSPAPSSPYRPPRADPPPSSGNTASSGIAANIESALGHMKAELEQLDKEERRPESAADVPLSGGGLLNDGDFEKALDELLEGVFSRDVLHEPMRQVLSRFEPWLDAQRQKRDEGGSDDQVISEEDLGRYERQVSIYRQVVALFDQEEQESKATSTTGASSTDPSPTTLRIQELLVQLQEFGKPPEEVMRDLGGPGALDHLSHPHPHQPHPTAAHRPSTHSSQPSNFTEEDARGFAEFLRFFGFDGSALESSRLTPSVLSKLAQGDVHDSEVQSLIEALGVNEDAASEAHEGAEGGGYVHSGGEGAAARQPRDHTGDPDSCKQQ